MAQNWWKMKIKISGKVLDKKRILNAWVLFNIRQRRGTGIINYLKIEQIILLAGAITVIVPGLTKIMIIVFALSYLIFTYYLGFYDEKKVKLWQVESYYRQQHANPFMQRMERRLIRIENKLKIDQGKDKEVEHSGK